MCSRSLGQESLAAIVCEHIAQHNCVIRSAFKTEPVEPEDSGWQFFCGEYSEEDPKQAKIWLLQEVLELEPTLAQLLNVPVGTRLSRQEVGGNWTVESATGQNSPQL